ncbi:MAG: DUF1992 domain-containing protein [Actinomycetota bacterium]
MPTGQPDPHFLPQERSDVGGSGPKGRRGLSCLPGYDAPSPQRGNAQQEYATSVDVVHGHAERLIQEAMEAGEFDDLPGTGKPIPGAGTVDDELWWVRSWLQRNQEQR